MPILLDNKILQATEAKIESVLHPETRAAYMKIVVAGGETALHGGPNGMLAKLKMSRDPIKSCAEGAVNLVFMMRLQAKGTMPIAAMQPAATTLMLQAMDFADRTGVVKIGAQDVARGMDILTTHFFGMLGVTPQKLSTMAKGVHNIMQDPTKMELIKRRAGVVRDPRASTPTLPETAPMEANDAV